MLNQKITRKDFIVTILSFVGLFAINKVPKTIKEVMSTKKQISSNKNYYGNHTYGGNA